MPPALRRSSCVASTALRRAATRRNCVASVVRGAGRRVYSIVITSDMVPLSALSSVMRARRTAQIAAVAPWNRAPSGDVDASRCRQYRSRSGSAPQAAVPAHDAVSGDTGGRTAASGGGNTRRVSSRPDSAARVNDRSGLASYTKSASRGSPGSRMLFGKLSPRYA